MGSRVADLVDPLSRKCLASVPVPLDVTFVAATLYDIQFLLQLVDQFAVLLSCRLELSACPVDPSRQPVHVSRHPVWRTSLQLSGQATAHSSVRRLEPVVRRPSARGPFQQLA